MMRWLGLVIFVLGLAACATPFDETQARLCREVLAGVEPAASTARITGIRQGFEPGSIRIDYRLANPVQTGRAFFVICRFAQGGFGAGREELIGVETHQGQVSGASLYFLRRFFLNTPDAAPAAPRIDPSLRGNWLVPLPAGTARYVQALVSGLPLAATYALIASAYALIYGLIGRIILSFGEIMTAGSIVTILTVVAAQWGYLETPVLLFMLAVPAMLWANAWIGHVTARLLLVPLSRQSGQVILIASLSLGLVLSEGLRLLHQGGVRWLPPIWTTQIPLGRDGSFVVNTSPVQLGVSLVALLLAGSLLLFMRHSHFGRLWRAVADDATAGQLFGIDPARVLTMSMILASMLAGMAGLLITVQFGGLGFAGGAYLGLKALVGAILGGIGSVPGAMIGGIVIAMLESLWSATLPIIWRDAFIFSLLSVFLVFRPNGFMGHQQDQPLNRHL